MKTTLLQAQRGLAITLKNAMASQSIGLCFILIFNLNFLVSLLFSGKKVVWTPIFAEVQTQSY